jgi:hypothetical protein
MQSANVLVDTVFRRKTVLTAWSVLQLTFHLKEKNENTIFVIRHCFRFNVRMQ